METNINDFIDFKGLFESFFKEFEQDLKSGLFEVDHFRQILDFKNNQYSTFEIGSNECEFNEFDVVFVFSICTNQATESNPQGDWSIVTIVFDLQLEEFTSFDIE